MTIVFKIPEGIIYYVVSKHNFIHKGENSCMFQLAISRHCQAEHEENEKEDLQLHLMVEISNLQR
jgi:hypothetical protein